MLRHLGSGARGIVERRNVDRDDRVAAGRGDRVCRHMRLAKAHAVRRGVEYPRSRDALDVDQSRRWRGTLACVRPRPTRRLLESPALNPAHIALVLACSLGLATAAHAVPQDAHADHAALAEHAPIAVPAQRWTTGAPLREGMARVHAVLDELRHFEMGHMGAEVALDRIATIEDATAFMVANCKLAPQADAALHGMLLPLLTAAQRLRTNPQDLDAVAAMRTAVANYPRYFDTAPVFVPTVDPGPDVHVGHGTP